jgi:endonuclease-3
MYKIMQRQKIKDIINILSKNFPSTPALKFSTPYELLVAVMLSAQCTDERVNKVTEKLFSNFNTPEKMVTLSNEQLEKYIFSCGLYRSKAEHILSASKDILEKFNGQVPSSLQELQSLAGVGRKTANVVYSVAFNGDAIAVDTHVFRVSNRIGLANGLTELKTEKDLMKNIEKKEWKNAHHYLIYLGRTFCKAQKPNCADCPIKELCEQNFKR